MKSKGILLSKILVLIVLIVIPCIAQAYHRSHYRSHSVRVVCCEYVYESPRRVCECEYLPPIRHSSHVNTSVGTPEYAWVSAI